jgi:hypothetical protein
MSYPYTLGGKSEGNETRERLVSRYENNIQAFPQEEGQGGMDWMCQDVNTEQRRALGNHGLLVSRKEGKVLPD